MINLFKAYIETNSMGTTIEIPFKDDGRLVYYFSWATYVDRWRKLELDNDERYWNEENIDEKFKIIWVDEKRDLISDLLEGKIDEN